MYQIFIEHKKIEFLSIQMQFASIILAFYVMNIKTLLKIQIMAIDVW